MGASPFIGSVEILKKQHRSRGPRTVNHNSGFVRFTPPGSEATPEDLPP
jgi:hypothetical protein